MKIHSAASIVDGSPEFTGDAPSDGVRHSFRDEIHEKTTDEIELDLALGQTEIFEADVAFCSRSEAICAEMLKRFVPHFTLQQGVTFQVAIGIDGHGNTLAVDFLVDGVLFEYHPVRLFKNKRRCGDFNSKREYRAYTDICHSLGAEQREFFQAAMRARLTDNYYHKRRALLDQHPVYRRMELVVATTPEEFYHLVLRRFGKNVPRTVERFMALFDELRESLPG